MIKNVTGLLLALCAMPCIGQESVKPWEEYGKLISASQGVTTLGPELFGDQVDLANGGLTFSATDVSVRGNNALPVAFKRTFAVGNRKGFTNDGLLADWELDLPSLSGVFAPTWPNTRCNVTTPGAALPPQVTLGGTVFMPEDYWHGNQANMPGGGEMMLVKSGIATPTTGGPYRWMTAGFTVFSCLPTILNGPGEGFLAITTDGTKYRFDTMAQFLEPALSAARPGELPGNVTAPRRRNVLYASRVEDRFGNWVNYTYANGSVERARLTMIESSDGRRLTFDYNERGFISAVHNGVQLWTYTYIYPTKNTATLAQVTLPDASRWVIAFEALSKAKILYEGGQGEPVRSCESAGLISSPGATGTITHPSGAVGEFRVEPMTHGRSNVPKVCINWEMPVNNPNNDVAYYPVSYDAFSLTRKRVTGPGLPEAIWDYAYTADIFFAAGTGPVCTNGSCIAPICVTDSCAGRAKTTVVGPNNRWTRYTFGNSYRYDEGKLLKTEIGSGPGSIKKTETATYVLTTTTQSYPVSIGTSPQPRGGGYASEYPRPKLRNVIAQDGATFTWQVNACGTSACFDEFLRPTRTFKSSVMNLDIGAAFERYDALTYHDNRNRWVVGQLATSQVYDPRYEGSINELETIYDATTAVPLVRKSFGRTVQTLGYNPDGTVATVKDGKNQTTSLSNWKRGIPQSIVYADNATESAIVNDLGWVTSSTDENNFTTSYGYDAIGRLTSTTYPTADTTAWQATTRTMQLVTTAEVDLPAGHWRQTVSTGNARTVRYFDAFWRPVVTKEYDANNEVATTRFTRRAYDASGHETFVSYPGLSHALALGIRTTFDSLDRITATTQDSELGALVSTTDYLSGYRTRVTNPRGFTTTTGYMAYDQPTTQWPRLIEYSEGSITVFMPRDAFGKPTSVLRQGGNANSYFSFSYDNAQRFCKQQDMNSGQNITMDYDAADNMIWSASHVNAQGSIGCDTAAGFNSGHRVDRTYDARNRIQTVTFPDHRGDQVWTYTADGLPEHISTLNSTGVTAINRYTYNKRRLMTQERLTEAGLYDRTIGYRYDANASLDAITYPSGNLVEFAPNGLGQPTKVGNAVSLVSYAPNGAVESYKYENGIIHMIEQNTRQLPSRVTDFSLGLSPHNYAYYYDANGNVSNIVDERGGRESRNMSYDGLDRLKTVTSEMYGPTPASYTYDDVSNLKTVVAPGRNHTYSYSFGRLSTIKNTVGGAITTTLQYDQQGNLSNKNGQAYSFDYGNRLRDVPGRESYRYDAFGRRIQARNATLGNIQSQYGHDGNLLFQRNERRGVDADYLYLAGKLIAIVEKSPSNSTVNTMYQHTDILGSPVAVTTNFQVVTERSEYEPFGALLGRPLADGPGYTGHVADAQTKLVYMEQRYYDPVIGQFLSVDPVSVDGNSGYNINRYAYAAGNPYKYVDPDGRENEYGIEVSFDTLFARADNPNKRDVRTMEAAQRSVDLTVNAAIASKNPERMRLAQSWNVTVDPSLSASKSRGIAETTVDTQKLDGASDMISISTLYSGDILGLSKPNSGNHPFVDGLRSNGGDATLFQVGAHELAHGTAENIAVEKAQGIKASELNAGSQVQELLKSSPDVSESQIRREPKELQR